MGVDAEIYVRSDYDIDDETLNRLAYEFMNVTGMNISNCGDNVFEPNVFERVEHDVDSGENVKINILGFNEKDYLYRVMCHERYYGEDYERGDWPRLRIALEFLKYHLYNADVYYGGDSDDNLELVTREFLDEMTRYYLENGTRPYVGGFRTSLRLGNFKTDAPTCDKTGKSFTNVGGGPDCDFWVCMGCGKKIIAYTDGNQKVVNDFM